MLSRKYYKLIAKCINDNIIVDKDDIGFDKITLHNNIVHDLCRAFKDDNTLFDWDKFKRACFINYEEESEDL